MSESEKWRSDFAGRLAKAGLNPRKTLYVDPAKEPVYEYSDGRTIETTPEGGRWLVEWVDGKLQRIPLPKEERPKKRSGNFITLSRTGKVTRDSKTPSNKLGSGGRYITKEAKKLAKPADSLTRQVQKGR